MTGQRVHRADFGKLVELPVAERFLQLGRQERVGTAGKMQDRHEARGRAFADQIEGKGIGLDHFYRWQQSSGDCIALLFRQRQDLAKPTDGDQPAGGFISGGCHGIDRLGYGKQGG